MLLYVTVHYTGLNDIHADKCNINISKQAPHNSSLQVNVKGQFSHMQLCAKLQI